MNDIIKSVNYQIRRDNFTVYAAILGILCALSGFLDAADDVLEMSGGAYVASDLFRQAASMMPLVVLFMCTRICGWDFNDKTINYDVLYGHKKHEVFFGRVIPAVAWSISFSFVLLILPVVVLTVKNGWGQQAEFLPLLARLALMLLPLLRVACEMILLTFLLRNCYLALIAGYFTLFIPFVISSFAEELSSSVTLSWHFSISNIVQLFTLNARMGFIDGKDVVVYDTAISAGLLVGTIAASIVMSAASLLVGLALFRKKDMR
ncbi:MAG: hypothetical protein ACI4Q4_05630 [Oscillospiraceae bacterium]